MLYFLKFKAIASVWQKIIENVNIPGLRLCGGASGWGGTFLSPPPPPRGGGGGGGAEG
jgi:hypothetical protein